MNAEFPGNDHDTKDLRAAFEAWFRSVQLLPLPLTRCGSGYADPSMKQSWAAWQACWEYAWGDTQREKVLTHDKENVTR
jgi:hypothetical protein